MSITRFWPPMHAVMDANSPDGPYVRYEDHIAAMAAKATCLRGGGSHRTAPKIVAGHVRVRCTDCGMIFDKTGRIIEHPPKQDTMGAGVTEAMLEQWSVTLRKAANVIGADSYDCRINERARAANFRSDLAHELHVMREEIAAAIAARKGTP
jgi:hypothetical protein